MRTPNNRPWLVWGLPLLGTVLGAVLVSAISGLVGIDKVQNELLTTVYRDVPRLVTITHARRGLRNLALFERELLLAQTDDQIEHSISQSDEIERQLILDLDRYERIMPRDDRADLLAVRDAWKEWRTRHSIVRERCRQHRPQDALALVPPTIGLQTWDLRISTLVARNEERVAMRAARSLQVRSRARTEVMVGSGIAAAAALALGMLALARLTRYFRELKQLNARLDSIVQEKTAALRLVLDSTGDGLLPLGTKGEILEGWSSAVVDWFGPLTAPFPLVWDYLQLADGEDSATLRAAVSAALGNGNNETKQLNGRLRHADRTFGWDLRIVQADRKQDLALLLVIRDVSAEYTAGRLEAIHQQQKLESLGQLAAGVAHDFNNLLTVILGQTELLLLEPLNAEAEESVTNVFNATQKATDLVRRLLSFARRRSAQPEEMSVHAAIDNSVWLMRHTLGRQIEIEAELAASNDKVIGNASQLESAILNLGVNARDAMGGQGKIRIETSNVVLLEASEDSVRLKLKPGHYLMLRFSDSGPGIPPSLREQVFQPFFTTKPEGKGTGLGLSSVYRTIAEHRGTIVLQNGATEGATFCIYLPTMPE